MSTLDKIKEIISENLNVDIESITVESSILDDLGADSLDVMETIMSLEEEFNIKFSENEIKEIKTVQDLVNHIDSKS